MGSKSFISQQPQGSEIMSRYQLVQKNPPHIPINTNLEYLGFWSSYSKITIFWTKLQNGITKSIQDAHNKGMD